MPLMPYNESPIDMEELIDEIDRDMVPMVFESFLEDTRNSLGNIQQAIAEQNQTILRKQAHLVKGSLISIRAKRCADLAKHMEDCGHSADFSTATQLLPQQQQNYTRVQEYISGYLAGSMV